MSSTYSRWIFQGDMVDLSSFTTSTSMFLGATFSASVESREGNGNLRVNIRDRNTIYDEMLEMFHDLERPIFEENRRESNVGDGTSGMFCEVEEELYPECRKFTLFNSLVKLMHIEVLICWSYKSYDILLELLNEAFLDGVNLPTSYYEAKKMLHDLGMQYKSLLV